MAAFSGGAVGAPVLSVVILWRGNMKLKHWIGVFVVALVACYVFNAGILGGVPVVGKYVSA